MLNTNTRVLYLSYDGLTDPLGQSQILPYLCGLSSSYSITIVSFEKKDRFTTGRIAIEAMCNAHFIIWSPLIYHKSPPILSTLYDVFRLKQKVKSLHLKNSYNIIHCRSYITSLVGLWLKRTYGVKLIFDMRGFWADERVDGGIWNLKQPLYKIIYKFFKEKERQFIQESDHTISLTHNAKNEILSWSGNASITVIPCCVDLQHFDPDKIDSIEKEKLKLELGIRPGDFVLFYLGSWGTWYMTKELLEFFYEFKMKHTTAKFLIVTGDQVILNNYPQASDVIIRKATRSEVPLFVSIASCSVFFIKPTYSKKASSATKMGEIMAMNVPIITNKGWGDAEEIIKSTGGYLHEIGAEIDTEKLKKINSETRQYCDENLSLETGVAKYAIVYSSLVKS